jgi:hypothetical protein
MAIDASFDDGCATIAARRRIDSANTGNSSRMKCNVIEPQVTCILPQPHNTNFIASSVRNDLFTAVFPFRRYSASTCRLRDLPILELAPTIGWHRCDTNHSSRISNDSSDNNQPLVRRDESSASSTGRCHFFSSATMFLKQTGYKKAQGCPSTALGSGLQRPLASLVTASHASFLLDVRLS